MKEYQLIMYDGKVVTVTADDIKEIGTGVYQVMGQKWTRLYHKDKVKYFYIKKGVNND